MVLDGAAVPVDDRQALARMLGYSETVFVDDGPSRQSADLHAGGRAAVRRPPDDRHGLAAVAARGSPPTRCSRPPARSRSSTGTSGRPSRRRAPEWSPPFELIEHGSAAAVEALPVSDEGFSYDWAWIDEEAGLVRARSFVPEAGVGEDEATGAAAVKLCAALGREIEVRQGQGSVIHARPMPDADGETTDLVEFGGIVVEV